MKKIDRIGRIMPPEENIDLWVSGKSVHNGERPGEGECCPDFSCCKPSLSVPEPVRRRYKEADGDERMQMLMEFLGALAASQEQKVHVAGQVEAYGLDDPERKVH